jgi:hypothetical protein
VRIVIDINVSERCSPELGVVPGNSVLNFLDVEQVCALLERIADVIDVQVQELGNSVSVVEEVVKLVSDVPVSSVVEVVRTVLKFLLNLDTRQSFLGDQILMQVPFKDLVEVVHDVLRRIHFSSN